MVYSRFFQGEDLELSGSWTPFNKSVSKLNTVACREAYLPVTPHPPEYPVCKDYLDFLIEIIEEFELPHIFVHSDGLVYSKLCDIVWKDQELYSKLIQLTGGFLELRVMQRLIYKRHHTKGIKEWCVDANTIAKGTSDSAFEGLHYFRSMKIHKELFDALIQYRFEEIRCSEKGIDEILYSDLLDLRKYPSPVSLKHDVNSQNYGNLVTNIL